MQLWIKELNIQSTIFPVAETRYSAPLQIHASPIFRAHPSSTWEVTSFQNMSLSKLYEFLASLIPYECPILFNALDLTKLNIISIWYKSEIFRKLCNVECTAMICLCKLLFFSVTKLDFFYINVSYILASATMLAVNRTLISLLSIKAY